MRQLLSESDVDFYVKDFRSIFPSRESVLRQVDIRMQKGENVLLDAKKPWGVVGQTIRSLFFQWNPLRPKAYDEQYVDLLVANLMGSYGFDKDYLPPRHIILDALAVLWRLNQLTERYRFSAQAELPVERLLERAKQLPSAEAAFHLPVEEIEALMEPSPIKLPEVKEKS
jgi:hypothetical protein